MKTEIQIQSRLQKMFADARQTHAYKAQGASLEFTEDLVRLMNVRGVSNSELARRIEVSPAYITKILRGGTNFTLDTMVKIASALDSEFRCHLQPSGHRTQWFDVLDGLPSEECEYRASDFRPVSEQVMNPHAVHQ